MEPPKGWKGSQKAIILAGIILGCVLQLGAVQQRVSVILEPPNLQEGQNVTLSVRGGPRQFVQCEWYQDTDKGEPENILAYHPNPVDRQRNVSARSWRETVTADCSLRIAKLKQSDTGNYSVIFETSQPPDKTPGQSSQEFYEGSVYLQVSALNQITIPVLSVPQQPGQGQEVTLTPQGTPQELEFCEWFKQEPSGNLRSIIRYSPREQLFRQSNHTDSYGKTTVGQDCSLRITKLTTADSGTYSVEMEVHLDRQQPQPGQGTHPQGPGGIQEYWGQVELKVNQASHQGKYAYGQSAGLRYSAGIIVGALLGSFAWTDTFTSLFSVLCSSSSRPGHLL